jgi:hypothetical protein
MMFLALAAATSFSTTAEGATSCRMPPDDRAWIDSALRASDYMMNSRMHLRPVPHPTIITFNEQCRFELKAGSNRWVGEPHQGKIRLLHKGAMNAGLIAMEDNDEKTGERYFVIALPSIWRAAKVIGPTEPGPTPVFLHEFSHARQDVVLDQLFRAAGATYKTPDYFNDDSLQDRFKSDPAYVAVYEKEDALLYQAAAEPDLSKARALAKQALDLMEARQKRWFTGPDEMWKPYDDLFLSMEGFGQWIAYAWLSDPKGGAMTTEAAREKMRGKRHWWSQEEGLGLFLVIDRLVPDWPAQAFADQPKLGIDLLREAVAPQASATNS